MHGLRKDSTRHRGIRPGVLSQRVIARVFPLLLTAAVGLSGCTARAPAAATPPVGTWLQLHDGTFQSIPSPDAGVVVNRAPWTVQSRLADMAFLGDGLFGAVNGVGLVSFTRGSDGHIEFSYHPDPLIFAHRTITTLVPRQGALTVHLYYNALLNDARPQDLSFAGISLVSYVPRLDDYSFLIPPFQRKNPDWEAVGFVAESENSFHFEWKFTDASETRFQYTRFHADTKAEEASDRDSFLAALGVPAINGPQVPSTLAAFFAACQAQLPSVTATTSLQFSLRSRESPVKRSYRSRKESEAAVVIPVFEEGGRLLALLPDSRVLSVAPDAVSETLALPKLPEGFRYTDIVKWGPSLVLPWEEVSFTDVARAGILIYPLER